MTGKPAKGASSAGDARRLEVSLAVHQGGDGGRVVAPAVGIVGQAVGHQQRAQVCVAESQRAEVVRILGDTIRGVAGVVHQDFLRGNHDVHGVLEGFHFKLAVGSEELHQVQRRQVAGRVVQEHILAARVGGIDGRRGLATCATC